MKKGVLNKSKDVFGFTFSQATKTKSFAAATIGVALLLVIGMMAISVLMANSANDDKKPSTIKNVYFCDQSGLTGVDLSQVKQVVKKIYDDVTFTTVDSTDEYSKKEDSNQDVAIELTKEKDHYLMKMLISESSTISKGEGEDLLDDLQACIEQAKVMSSGIGPEKLVVALADVNVECIEAGEEGETIGEMLTKMFLPLLIVFFLYMMILLYGQSIGKSIVSEKSSKLMEMFLTSIRPSALIFGKVMANISVAIMQILIWIGASIAGFFAGHQIALQIAPKYKNVIIEVIKMIQKDTKTAFSPLAIALAVVLVIVGFIFYCMISAAVSSGIAKAEDLSQGMGGFTMVTVIGFLGAYMLPMQENEKLNVILRLNPITGAFLTGGDVLIGNAPLWQGVVCLGVEIVCIGALVVLTSKIYRNKVFYNGNSILKQTIFKKRNA